MSLAVSVVTSSARIHRQIIRVDDGRVRALQLASRKDLLSAVVIFALGLLPEKVSADDPQLRPLYEAIDRRPDRAALGFTPIPQGGEMLSPG